jgi:uncharacterized membrane protein YhaH (DUF805 family)
MTMSQKLFSFEGRLRRMDWWLLGILVGFMGLVANLVLRFLPVPNPLVGSAGFPQASLFEILVTLPVLWMQMALSAKRAHDVNLSAAPFVAFQLFSTVFSFLPAAWAFVPGVEVGPGWGWLLSAVFIIGGLAVFIWLGFIDGTPGPNRFGPSPKWEARAVFNEPGGLG